MKPDVFSAGTGRVLVVTVSFSEVPDQYTADVCRTDNGGTTQAPDAVGAPSACNGTDAGRCRTPCTST